MFFFVFWFFFDFHTETTTVSETSTKTITKTVRSTYTIPLPADFIYPTAGPAVLEAPEAPKAQKNLELRSVERPTSPDNNDDSENLGLLPRPYVYCTKIIEVFIPIVEVRWGQTRTTTAPMPTSTSTTTATISFTIYPAKVTVTSSVSITSTITEYVPTTVTTTLAPLSKNFQRDFRELIRSTARMRPLLILTLPWRRSTRAAISVIASTRPRIKPH